MFFLTNGYLNKLFQCKNLMKASKQNDDVVDNSLIRLNDKKSPLIKVITVMTMGSLTRLLTSDSENEAFIWIDSEVTEEFDEGKDLQTGSIILIKEFSLMPIKTAIQIYGGIEENYHFDARNSIENTENCIFLTDYQLVGIETTMTLSRSMTQLGLGIDNDEFENKLINQLNSKLDRSSWGLTALLTKRTQQKNFMSKTGSSCCYSRFQLSDKTGTIEMVAFNQYSMKNIIQDLEVNRVYTIKFGDIKAVRINCSAWMSDHASEFEIVVTSETEFSIVDADIDTYQPAEEENRSNPQLSSKNAELQNRHGYFDFFTEINHLRFTKIGELVNVYGIITKIDPELRYIERANGKSLAVMNFDISDSSNNSVTVAMWGLEAQNHGLKIGQVVELNKMKLTNFGGISLSKLIISSVKDITSMDNHIIKDLVLNKENQDKRKNPDDFSPNKRFKE